jgi:hypothetical protein
MGTAISPRCIAVIFATLLTVGIPFSSAVAQGARGPHWPEGCLAEGLQSPGQDHLPNLWGDYVVVSDERRTAEQLAATFADPADALARLNAWCWLDQQERVYFNTRDQLTVDVSIHDFSGSEGATLAQRWFSYQRANDLGLDRDILSREHLEEDLGLVNIEALDNIDIAAYSNDTEHTLYARREGGDKVVRVSVSGEPVVDHRSREVVAYQVLAEVFGVNLFQSRE